jgi:hypothetical protein
MRDGERVEYDALISTLPLDRLLMMLDVRRAEALRSRFVHSSSHIVGVGLTADECRTLQTKCWIYFPEPQVPFYRATVFSNYSPNNAPDGHWSLMAEVSESPEKPVLERRSSESRVGVRSDAGSSIGRMWSADGIAVSKHGYPTPWLGARRGALAEAERALHARTSTAAGVSAPWKYEVSNQDHSLMQGRRGGRTDS